MRAKDLFEAHFPQSDLEFLFSNRNDARRTFCFSIYSFNTCENVTCASEVELKLKHRFFLLRQAAGTSLICVIFL